MTVRPVRRTTSRGRLWGFSLVEVAISTAIVGVMLVAALHAVASARMGLSRVQQRSKGMLLAQGLMAEILQQDYADADFGTDSFGLGGSEGGSNRAAYDDVDDYDGWSASPPETRDGTPIPGTDGYERLVVVDWVTSSDTTDVRGESTGAKRIIVTVKFNGIIVAELVGLRTLGWDHAVPNAGGD